MKKMKVEIKGKGIVHSNSPWRCVWCTEVIETPQELGRNQANLPVHEKCVKAMADAQEKGKFTPRTESLSENGRPEPQD